MQTAVTAAAKAPVFDLMLFLTDKQKDAIVLAGHFCVC